jgi:hypothetical protein
MFRRAAVGGRHGRSRLIPIAVAFLLVPAAGIAATPVTAAAAGVSDPLDGSAAAVESMSSGRLDLFTRGADGALHTKVSSGGAWSGWDDLGGSITSAPAVAAWGPNRLDIFARGANNALYHIWYNGTWHAWENLGGNLASAPAVAAWGPNRLDVFARGTDNTLQHRWYDGAWHDWESLGGTLTSAPTATSQGSGKLDVLALDSAGDLQQKSYSGSWAAWQRVSGFAPTVPVEPFSRTSALQAAPAGAATIGPIEYAYVDNLGRLVYGWQPDPDNTASLQWTADPTLEAFSGQPCMAAQADGRVQLAAHNANGDVWVRTQAELGSSAWSGWADAGGWVTSTATSGRLSDGRLALFAVDADGRLWSKAQGSANGAYGLWRDLGDIDLAGAPTAVTLRTGLQLFALDTAGVLRTATYDAAGALSAWTALSATGLTGAPAVVVYPGFSLRVFARAADGTIITKRQDSTGAFPVAWDPVGSMVTAGSPAALISPRTGLTEVVVRGTDGMIYNATETAQASGAWLDWRPALPTDLTTATDPTALTFNATGGPRWGFVFRTSDNQSYMFVKEQSSLSAAGGRSAVGGASFTGNALPAPPS